MITTYSTLEEIRDRLNSSQLSSTDVFHYRITLLNACGALFLASEKSKETAERINLLEQYTLLQRIYQRTQPGNTQVDPEGKTQAIEAINEVISQLAIHQS